MIKLPKSVWKSLAEAQVPDVVWFACTAHQHKRYNPPETGAFNWIGAPEVPYTAVVLAALCIGYPQWSKTK